MKMKKKIKAFKKVKFQRGSDETTPLDTGNLNFIKIVCYVHT